MSLERLPKFEMYEEGAQIRRSIKSVKANIAEGYGRRRYKQEFIRFLTYALASCNESTDHLDTLHATGSLAEDDLFESLCDLLDELGKKLNKLIQSVEREHQSVREPSARGYAELAATSPDNIDHPTSNIEHPTSNIQHPPSSGQDPDP
jgi:four helix bundle protein